MGLERGRGKVISEAGMFQAVETLRHEMEMSCPEGPGISECRNRKWEAKSHKVGEKGFGRAGGRKAGPSQGDPLCHADHCSTVP